MNNHLHFIIVQLDQERQTISFMFFNENIKLFDRYPHNSIQLTSESTHSEKYWLSWVILFKNVTNVGQRHLLFVHLDKVSLMTLTPYLVKTLVSLRFSSVEFLFWIDIAHYWISYPPWKILLWRVRRNRVFSGSLIRGSIEWLYLQISTKLIQKYS